MTITKYTGLDPEIAGGDTAFGFDARCKNEIDFDT